MSIHPTSIWEGFLPPGAIVMGKVVSAEELSSHDLAITPRVRVFFQIPETLGRETETLFFKMVAAMGLSLDEIAYGADFNGEANFVVRLRGGESLGAVTGSEISTHSLADLLLKPELKREAWNHLKIVAQALGLPSGK